MSMCTRSFDRLRTLVVSAVLAFCLLGPSLADAQPPQPAIKFIFPAGGQRGKCVDVIVNGTGLQGAGAVRVSGEGVSGRVLKVENPSLLRIAVTIDPDATVGERDLRVMTPAGGVSNRFRFFVGELPEINEKEPNSLKSQSQRLETLPIVVNGQIHPSDTDFFRFAAKAGETLVCHIQARELLPYIADAVPGWLETCLTLYDAGGKELASVGRFRFNPDPLLIYRVPQDGEYLIEVRDLFYRGREDFVYRLSLGAFPYITDIFPLGGQRASDCPIELYGANLPMQSTKLVLPGDSSPLRLVSLGQNGLNSNALPFAVGDQRETRVTEANQSFDRASRIEAPVTLNGRIRQRGEAHYFRFAVKRGQRYIMEVQARRLGSPLDSILTLFNSQGGQLAEQDDTDMGDPLLTHHADSRLDYTFPADGDYVLRIQDAQGRGGEECAYRLHIVPPRPDFSLRTVPDNPRLGAADSVAVTVKALRQDGFNGQIDLSVQNLPKGFVASKAVIPAGQSETRLTLTAPADASVGLGSPTIVGAATLGEQTAVRQAVAAEDLMQAFSLRHDVPTKEFLVAVIESPDFTVSTNMPSTDVRDVRQESQVVVVVKVSRKGLEAAIARAEAAKKAAEGVLTKAKQGKLAADEKAAAVTLDQANKSLDAARQKAKQEIRLTADPLPGGVTFAPANIAPDKSEAKLTLGITPQAPVGSRQSIIITGSMGFGDTATVHVAPALPIRVIESAKALQAVAVAKRRQANEAKKKLDDLVEKQQKPAEARLATAAQAVTAAATDKAATDKTLAEARDAAVKVQTTLQAAEKAANEAETQAAAIAKDAGKSAVEKKRVAEAAAAGRKAAAAAKAGLAEVQKKQQQAQTRSDAMAKKLAEVEAQRKAVEQALAEIKNQASAAGTLYLQAEATAKEAEVAAAQAKS
jgi:hypothetical protein